MHSRESVLPDWYYLHVAALNYTLTGYVCLDLLDGDIILGRYHLLGARMRIREDWQTEACLDSVRHIGHVSLASYQGDCVKCAEYTRW